MISLECGVTWNKKKKKDLNAKGCDELQGDDWVLWIN